MFKKVHTFRHLQIYIGLDVKDCEQYQGLGATCWESAAMCREITAKPQDWKPFPSGQ